MNFAYYYISILPTLYYSLSLNYSNINETFNIETFTVVPRIALKTAAPQLRHGFEEESLIIRWWNST